MNTWQELVSELTETGNLAGDVTRVQLLKEQDKVAYCLSNKHLRSVLVDWIRDTISLNNSSKSACKSVTYRQLGNDKFKTGDDSGAFELYTKSLLFAPINSTEIALAYANRSATEFHLQLYSECIADIDLAISNGYSEQGKYKLLARKGKCLMKLEKYFDAIKILNESLNSIESLEKVPSSKKIAIKQDVQEALSMSLKYCRLGSNSFECKEDILSVERYEDGSQIDKITLQSNTPSSSSSISSSLYSLPSLTNGESHIIPCASSKIKLQTSNAKGRHVIAVEDIYKGDTLFVEKPISFVVLQDCNFNHCNHCCAVIISPIPCSECVLAVYCTERCRLNAWQLYHKWECHGGLYLMESLGIAHLALKLILISGTHSRYKDVYQLEAHIEHMKPFDLYQYTLTAMLLTLYLEDFTDYLSSECALHYDKTMSLIDDIGHRTLRHIGQLICNGHAITKLAFTDSSENEISTQDQVRIATAIFPSASMMNHSCDPNIINSFSDQYLIVRAAKDIPSGTEVLNCYGPHFRRMRLQDRKEALREQYFFECVCESCCSPVEIEFTERSYGMLCSVCEGPLIRKNETTKHMLTCADCSHDQDVAELINMDLNAHNNFTIGMSLMDRGNTQSSITELLKCLRIREKCLYKYNKELLYTKDMLAKCYATLGDYNESIIYIEDCIKGVKHIYGENSIELSNELNKLTDIMIANIQSDDINNIDKIYIDQTLKYINTCKDIIELNYGMWNNEYKYIVEKLIKLQKLIKDNQNEIIK